MPLSPLYLPGDSPGKLSTTPSRPDIPAPPAPPALPALERGLLYVPSWPLNISAFLPSASQASPSGLPAPPSSRGADCLQGA